MGRACEGFCGWIITWLYATQGPVYKVGSDGAVRIFSVESEGSVDFGRVGSLWLWRGARFEPCGLGVGSTAKLL